MAPLGNPIDTPVVLQHVAETLNRAVDVREVLNHALADLVELMRLESGWVALRNPSLLHPPQGSSYVLAAYHNLPPALDPQATEAWRGTCTCQQLANAGRLVGAYNEVRCSRLEQVRGDRHGLAVHASVPLRSGERILGILNVAAPAWDSFSPDALALLTDVGNQMGLALERARLFDLLRDQRSYEQEALLDFSRQLLNHRDLDGLMHFLVEKVRQVVQSDACALLLPGDEPQSLRFLATSGWQTDPSKDRRQVPLDDSTGPGRVMKLREPLLIDDLSQDSTRPWTPPWLLAEGFRGHAVVPLLVEDRAIGTLVVNQRQPRRFNGDDLRCLSLMANQAAMAVEQTRLVQEEVKMQALERELALAREIQLSLLPGSPPDLPGWELAVFYKAAREVGGDFYDFFTLPGAPGQLGIVIADVTGKGIPAALFMARNYSAIRAAAMGYSSPDLALKQANEMILRDGQTELLLTALYGVLDIHSGKLAYANAGHLRPLWIQAANGQVHELSARGILLGAFGDIELEKGSAHLAPGDYLVLFTDGVTEAMDARRQPFGEERLHELLASHASPSAQALVTSVVDAIVDFTGEVSQSDDLALIVIRRCPVPAEDAE